MTTPLGRAGHHATIEACKSALVRSLICLWPECGLPQAQGHIGGHRAVPLCTAHMFEVWRICRDEANRMNNRDKTVVAVHEGELKKIERPVSTVGWVYYLRIGEHIKVGYAGRLLQRLRSYPPNAEFIYAHRGTKADEKVAHSMLYLHKAAGREWFTPHADVFEWIDKQKARYGPTSDPRVKPTHDALGAPIKQQPHTIVRG